MHLTLQKHENHQSFNVNIITRILKVLSDYGPIRISRLAMYASLNYKRCKNYLSLMEALNWLEIENDSNYILIKPTYQGKTILLKLDIFIKK